VTLQRTRLRAATASLIAAFALASVAQAEDDWRATASRAGVGTLDVLVIRPAQAAATAVGFALFVPAALVTYPGGRSSIMEAWDVFVATPARATFQRPIGDF